MGQHDEKGLRRGRPGGRGLRALVDSLIPGPAVVLWAALLGVGVAACVGAAAGVLRRRGTRVAYTRKVFHFGVFTGAGIVHAVWGLAGTNVYGGVVALVVLAAVVRGDGNALYEALARDTDRPHRSLFILVPLATTAVGGLASGLFAGSYATVGYLVAGWGDAIGEPVGSRWGRHRFRVPSLAGVPAQRSWEGSGAVLAASWLAATVALGAVGTQHLLAVAFACALVGTVVEALSHHGLDNLTIQLAASLTALWLSG